MAVVMRVVLPDHPAVEKVDKLTARQREVVELLVNGLTNQEIGHALGLSEHTIKNHIAEAIYPALEIVSRAELGYVWALAQIRQTGTVLGFDEGQA